MLAKNDINDVTAFRELLKESGFALEKMPEEMEADPLSRDLALLDSSNWTVAPTTFIRICRHLQISPQIDG